MYVFDLIMYVFYLKIEVKGQKTYTFVSFVFRKTKYRNHHVKIEFLISQNNRFYLNFNQIFDNKLRMQGLNFNITCNIKKLQFRIEKFSPK